MRAKLAWLLILSSLGALGLVLLATCFMIYDDEGYVLWSVHMFCQGHALYTEVYSQYGPLFYIGYRALHAISAIPFNNETGRLLTLIYWLGTTLAAGLIVQLLTKRLLAGLAAGALTFAFLFNNIREPFHPGSLLAFLSAVGAGLGAWLISHDRRRQFVWSVTLIAVAMAFIKINVGLFLGAALGGWMLINTSWPRWLRSCSLYASGTVAVLSSIAVLILLRTKLNETWAMGVAVVFIGGMSTLTSRISHARTDLYDLRDWINAGLVTLGVSAAIMLTMSLWGTSPAELLDAVLIAPLRHPAVYNFPPTISPAALLCAVVLTISLQKVTREVLKPRSLDCIAFLQVGSGLLFLYYARESAPNYAWGKFAYAFGPSLAALMVFPTGGEQDSPLFRARLWIAWVYIWQTLHAYPVAGTQLVWGSFLFIPIAIIGWFDAIEHLRLRFPKINLLAITVPLLAASLATAQLFQYSRVWWRYSVPLGLPGARWLRPQPDTATIFQVLQPNLMLHANTVFSFPGMFSFNIWSNKPTPTAANATHWFSLVPRKQQQEIVEKLMADPRACVVMNRLHLHYLYDFEFIPDSPLKDYLFHDFAPAIRIGNYDLWVKRGRRIQAVNTFRLDAGFARGWFPRPARTVKSVALIAPDAAPVELTWTITPAPQGQSLAHLDAFVPGPYLGAANIYLYDAHGEVIDRLVQNEAPNEVALALPPRPEINDLSRTGSNRPDSPKFDQ